MGKTAEFGGDVLKHLDSGFNALVAERVATATATMKSKIAELKRAIEEEKDRNDRNEQWIKEKVLSVFEEIPYELRVYHDRSNPSSIHISGTIRNLIAGLSEAQNRVFEAQNEAKVSEDEKKRLEHELLEKVSELNRISVKFDQALNDLAEERRQRLEIQKRAEEFASSWSSLCEGITREFGKIAHEGVVPTVDDVLEHIAQHVRDGRSRAKSVEETHTKRYNNVLVLLGKVLSGEEFQVDNIEPEVLILVEKLSQLTRDIQSERGLNADYKSRQLYLESELAKARKTRDEIEKHLGRMTDAYKKETGALKSQISAADASLKETKDRVTTLKAKLHAQELEFKRMLAEADAKVAASLAEAEREAQQREEAEKDLVHKSVAFDEVVGLLKSVLHLDKGVNLEIVKTTLLERAKTYKQLLSDSRKDNIMREQFFALRNEMSKLEAELKIIAGTLLAQSRGGSLLTTRTSSITELQNAVGVILAELKSAREGMAVAEERIVEETRARVRAEDERDLRNADRASYEDQMRLGIKRQKIYRYAQHARSLKQKERMAEKLGGVDGRYKESLKRQLEDAVADVEQEIEDQFVGMRDIAVLVHEIRPTFIGMDLVPVGNVSFSQYTLVFETFMKALDRLEADETLPADVQKEIKVTLSAFKKVYLREHGQIKRLHERQVRIEKELAAVMSEDKRAQEA